MPSFSSLLVACWPHDRRTSLALETIRISQGCLCVCRVDRCMVRGSVRTASRDSQEHRSLEEDSITERLLRYHRARAMVVRAAWVAAFPSQAPPILMTSSMSSTLACSRRVWIVCADSVTSFGSHLFSTSPVAVSTPAVTPGGGGGSSTSAPKRGFLSSMAGMIGDGIQMAKTVAHRGPVDPSAVRPARFVLSLSLSLLINLRVARRSSQDSIGSQTCR